VNEFTPEMKNSKATGYDVTPIEFRKIFYIRRDGTETLMKIINKTKKETRNNFHWVKIVYDIPNLQGKTIKKEPYGPVKNRMGCVPHSFTELSTS
jgi:hypothetical protein